MVALLGVTAVLVAGTLAATPAPASAASVVPAASIASGSLTSGTMAPAGADQALAERMAELVAAFDRTTMELDPSKVRPSTLMSDEGQAFVAAVSGGSEGSSASDDLDLVFSAASRKLAADGATAGGGTYPLAPGVTITYPSELGAAALFGRRAGAVPDVTGGSDPWPYIQLTNAEQKAMVTGASATLVAAICALLGPETAGVGCGVGAAGFSCQ